MSNLQKRLQTELPKVKEIIKSWEARKPHPDDRYLTDGKYVTRKELASEGIVFVNRVGDGEKRPLHGRKVLLTKEEVDEFLELDRRELAPKIAKGIQLDAVCDDMFDFLYGWMIATEERVAYRGIEVEDMFDRFMFMRKLNGSLCPFVDCGYVFQINPDLVIPIVTPKSTGKSKKSKRKKDVPELGRWLRMNDVTRHLATHGISERGGQGGNWTFCQEYITIRQYIDFLFKSSD